MNVVHAHPIVVAMAESRPQEAMVANRYNFRVVTTGQGFVSVSELPTCMVPGPGAEVVSDGRAVGHDERVTAGPDRDVSPGGGAVGARGSLTRARPARAAVRRVVVSRRRLWIQQGRAAEVHGAFCDASCFAVCAWLVPCLPAVRWHDPHRGVNRALR